MKLKRKVVASLVYHDIFDYPLTRQELERWETNKDSRFRIQDSRVKNKRGFYFLEGREGVVIKRLANEKASKKKLKIAKRASKILERIPTIRFVGITGSLAMNNSNNNSDIDLLIITTHQALWTTRIVVYILLLAFSFRLRRPGMAEEKDRLCLNMWLDEADLVFTKRNSFAAHEIAQIVPLVNKSKTYEELLWKNKWILDYWPNSAEIRNPNIETRSKLEFSKFKFLDIVLNLVFRASNFIAFKLQYLYMKPRITRELITKTRAFFHPRDLGVRVESVLTR